MHINLARKWRSKTFDEIIGQPMVVTLLRNSLARGVFFPVYLLAGLRGSGKTSIGRIFAAAVNCTCEDPHMHIPCLRCPSCTAMARGNHPDFIEIDAASHTGVDNVRQIIEEASFLPVLGRKKIYLIDEAHMLSKAAFNAFLKILEEPPVSVLFLLATTDRHKILDTVVSRSFQLFFDPVAVTDLVPHLQKVCAAEGIPCDRAGLQLVAQESEGSVRDALNIIERVRFSDEGVTAQSIELLLGYAPPVMIHELLRQIAEGDMRAVLDSLQQMRDRSYSATVVWQQLVQTIRTLLWIVGEATLPVMEAEQLQAYQLLAQACSFTQLIDYLDILYRSDAQYARALSIDMVFERAVIAMTQRSAKASVPVAPRPVDVSAPLKKQQNAKSVGTQVSAASDAPTRSDLHVAVSREEKSNAVTAVSSNAENSLWQQFVAAVGERVTDPIVLSVLRMGNVAQVANGLVRVQFYKKFVFYQDALLDSRTAWQPLLEEIFGPGSTLVPEFSLESGPMQSGPMHKAGGSMASARHAAQGEALKGGLPKDEIPHGEPPKGMPERGSVRSTQNKKIDASTRAQVVRNLEQFPMAQSLQELVPGTIKMVQEDGDE